jgi:hypothetical protein
MRRPGAPTLSVVGFALCSLLLGGSGLVLRYSDAAGVAMVLAGCLCLVAACLLRLRALRRAGRWQPPEAGS